MLRILPLLIGCFSLFAAAAQPATTRVAIANTGCTAEVYCAPGRFDTYEVEDGSTVYADDCETDGITFGIYCVKLIVPVADLSAAEDTVITYLDFLKLDYGIVESKGYDKGHLLNKNPATRGVYDTWEDADKNKWKIHAWTNGRLICILYMYSQKDLPDKKATTFLEGLRFPGMK